MLKALFLFSVNVPLSVCRSVLLFPSTTSSNHAEISNDINVILTFRMYNKSNVVEIYDNHKYLFLQIVRCQSVAGFIELRVFPRD